MAEAPTADPDNLPTVWKITTVFKAKKNMFQKGRDGADPYILS